MRISDWSSDVCSSDLYGSNIVIPLDVADDAQIDACFSELGKHWDGFDILVHCIAYAPREAIGGDFLDGISRENFAIAQDISAYSLAALAKAARPQMKGRNGDRKSTRLNSSQ